MIFLNDDDAHTTINYHPVCDHLADDEKQLLTEEN